jgi:Tfp pilus assembly pilus retraction ATPase PilT
MDDSEYLIDYVMPVDREVVRQDIASVLELVMIAQKMHRDASQSDNTQLEREVKRCKRLKRALKQAKTQSEWLRQEIDVRRMQTISRNLARAVKVRRSGLADLNSSLAKELRTLEAEVADDQYPYK